MEVLSKECYALSESEDEEGDSSEESVEEDIDEYPEGEEEYESEFVPGLVRFIKEKDEDDDEEGGDILEEDEHDHLLGTDDHDYLPHNNLPMGGGDHDYRQHNNLPLGGDDHDYHSHSPEQLFGDYPAHGDDAYNYEEDAYNYDDDDDEEEEEEEEELSMPTDVHRIKKKILPAEQARLGLVNRAMNKLLKDESEYAFIRANVVRVEGFTRLSISESVASLRNLQSHRSFKKFVKMYNREYEDMSEYKRRFATFRENMKKVQFLRETELGTAM